MSEDQGSVRELSQTVGVSAQEQPTPGPWGVWSSLYKGFVAAVVSGHEPGAELRTLAEVRSYRDALLMAAAPDMLAALQELHLKAVVGTDAERHAALDQAWAAISKATGQ